MARVFGNTNLIISVDCENEDETFALLEANYRFNPERFIVYKLHAIDCKGKEHTITVHDCEKLELEEFVD